jgi:hypothetical protein
MTRFGADRDPAALAVGADEGKRLERHVIVGTVDVFGDELAVFVPDLDLPDAVFSPNLDFLRIPDAFEFERFAVVDADDVDR